MDSIHIAGIEVWAHHGVLPHETEIGQRFVVDVGLEVDLAAAASSDHLADTVDYGALAQQVHDVVAGGPHQLIEAVAGRVLDVCLTDPKVTAATVTVHKPYAPLPVTAREVAVTLRRSR